MYNVLQDIENILSVSGRGDTLIWTWVMSYLIVTVWSHKEAFHWDRFMFAKESSEFFFSPYCIQSEISPLPVGLEYLGLQTFWADSQHTCCPLRLCLLGRWERWWWWWWQWLQEEGAHVCVSDHVVPRCHLLELETKGWAQGAQKGLNWPGLWHIWKKYNQVNSLQGKFST